MNILFILATIIICGTIPFWIIVLLLYILKAVINLRFTISGLYHITNISLGLYNEEFSFTLKLDSIKVIFSWPRTRFELKGLKIAFHINKSEFKENNPQYKNRINDISFIKEKFSEILKSKLWSNNKDNNNLLSFGEINHIDDMVKQKKSPIKNRLVLYILRFFDVFIERIKLTLKFKTKNVFYSIKIRKIITGVIKSPNKKSQIDIVGGVYDLNIREHIEKNAENNEDKKEGFKKKGDIRKYCSKNIYINKDNNSDNIKYKIIKLPSIAFKVAFVDGFFPAVRTLSITNKVKISIEGRDLVANISKRSVDNIILLIIGIIVSIYNNQEKNLNSKEPSNINKDSVDAQSYLMNGRNESKETICIEQVLVKKVESELKKLEIRLQNVKVNVYNDNYIYKYLTILLNGFKIERNSSLYLGSNIDNDLHLIKREMELHFVEIKIYQFKNKKLFPVTEVPFFDLSIKDNIVYHVKTQNADLITNISGKLSDIELILTTQNVNRIIELVITIVDGYDIIEYVVKAKKNSKFRIDQEYKDTTKIEIDLQKINAYIYSDDHYVNVKDVDLKINLEGIKGVSKLITLNFPLLNLAFSPNSNDPLLNNMITSHIILDGFKITIDDKKANGGERYYTLNFLDTFIIVTDRHLLAFLKFISEIAGFILLEEVERKLKKRTGKYGISLKKRAKKGTKLVFNKIEAVIIFHEDDITHSFYEDFVFVFDEYLSIPRAYMYHSTVLEKNNLFNKFIDIENFSIKFYSEYEFTLNCEDFKINYYEAYMARPIAHVILFLTFFADWFDYYFTFKFILDEETLLEKYEIMKDKVINKKFIISKFHFDINDNPVTSASIFQTNRTELEKNMASIISYLKKIKTNLLYLVFDNIEVEMTKVFKVTKNPYYKGGYNYYSRILTNNTIEAKIRGTRVDLEQNTILKMEQLYYKYYVKKDLYDYHDNEILTEMILYDRHTIIRKKIAYETKIESEIILKQDNITFHFQDIIVFDKTLTFIIKAFNAISKIPIKNCQTVLLMDRIPMYTKKVFFATIFGINGDIKSVDPKTKEVYNTLDIHIKEISYLSETELEVLEKLKDQYELSLHYLLFGFSPSQKSGFPLFSLPLCELNKDSIAEIMKINIPTDIPPDTSSYTAMFTEQYNEELNELVIKTKSLTIFLNYQYLDTFYKIFNVFWSKTSQIKKTFDTSNKKENIKDNDNEINSIGRRRTMKINSYSKIKSPSNNMRRTTKTNFRHISAFTKNSENKKEKKSSNIKLVLFDLKIIYLLEYKDDYKNIFSFHKFVEKHKYFGYIFRFYSFNLNYTTNIPDKILANEFKAMLHFLTVSFLDVDNLSDTPFFVKDSELKIAKFKNLKNIDIFNSFMELDKNNTSKVLNNNIDEFLIRNNYKKEKEELLTKKIPLDGDEMITETTTQQDYIDLAFDYRHTFIKISEFDFKRGEKYHTQEQIYKLNVSNGKIAWNKFNKDVLFLIIFKDLFLILDKIVLKDSKKDKDKDKKGDNCKNNELSKKSTARRLETISNSIKEQSKENSTSTNKLLMHTTEEEIEENESLEDEEEEEKEDKKYNSQMTFNFEFNNPQFVVQNELKGSALLLICKEPIKVVFNNYCFRNDLKDYKLSIYCRQLSLYSVLKSDKKDSVIYWMGDPTENQYHLSEEDFGKIIVSPKIDFALSQSVHKPSDDNLDNSLYTSYLNKNNLSQDEENNEKKDCHCDIKTDPTDYDIITKNEITIDKINGNFNSVYFSDFMNIISVLIFDRGFSFSQEKNSDNQIKEDMKKYKISELETKIKTLLAKNKVSNKVTSHVKFTLMEVTFNLCEDIDKLDSEHKNEKKNKKKGKKRDIIDCFKPLLQFQMKNFIGDHTIRDDKSSETRLDILKLLIKNVENEMSQPVFQPLVNSNAKGLENRLNMVFFKKKDRYIKLETNSLWYVLDEFEFNISPFSFHISKKQIVFILDFFFHSNEKNLWDEDKKNEKKKKEEEEKKPKKEEEAYPTYFKQFKINEIRCLLNFEYAEAHPLNIPMTKLKFHYFIKHDKFYPLSAMINRFLGHCKKELIKNFGNIISGLFSTKDYTYAPEKKEKDEEAAKRKLLFGDK